MNIGVLSFSGNVGKTILTDFVLFPRLRNTKLITVASQDNAKCIMQLEGADGERIQQELILNSCDGHNDLVIDISCSEIKSFIQSIEPYKRAMEDFNVLVIPVTPEKKQQRDTIRTIDTLLKMDVEKDRIVIVFNRILPQMKVRETFDTLIKYLSSVGINVSTDSYIPETDLFEQINESNDNYIESILEGNSTYSANVDKIDKAFELKCSLDGVANKIFLVFRQINNKLSTTGSSA